MTKRIVLISFFIFSALAVSPLNASAVDVSFPCFNLPGFPPCGIVSTSSIAVYISRFYQFAVGIVGIIAVGAIVVGAIIIAVSGDQPDKQKEGKNIIASAVWGVVLLLGATLILQTVNPRIAALTEPEVPKIPVCEYETEGKLKIKEGTPIICIPAAFTYKLGAIPGDSPIEPISSTALANVSADAWDYCGNIYPPLPPVNYPGTNVTILNQCLVQTTAAIKKWGSISLENLNPSLPMKVNQCRWYKEPSRCEVNPKTNIALLKLKQLYPVEKIVALINVGDRWEITEAFPPIVLHRSLEHYNGCAVDVITQTIGGVTDCPELQDFVNKAVEAGFEVFNEYKKICPNLTNVSGGEEVKFGHLHLTTKNCP